MFAIFQTGSKQYKVEVGDKIEMEKMELEPEAEVTFNEVLLLSDENKNEVGAPFVKGAIVKCKVLDQHKGEKIRVYKMKPKTRYQKTQGHRQNYTMVEILSISSK